MKNTLMGYSTATLQGYDCSNNSKEQHFGDASAVSYFTKAGKWPSFLKEGHRVFLKQFVNDLMNPLYSKISILSKDNESMKHQISKNYASISRHDKSIEGLFVNLDKLTGDIRKNYEDLSKKVMAVNNLYVALEKGVLKVTDFQKKVAVISKQIRDSQDKLEKKLVSHYQEFSKYPVLLNAFKEKVEKNFDKIYKEHDDFNNEVNSAIASSEDALNKANSVSADFSNHLEDYKSHVKSFEARDGDFVQTEKKVASMSDNFKNHVKTFNKLDADFKDHTIDYTLHKKPVSVIKKELMARKPKTSNLSYTLNKSVLDQAKKAKQERLRKKLSGESKTLLKRFTSFLYNKQTVQMSGMIHAYVADTNKNKVTGSFTEKTMSVAELSNMGSVKDW